LTRSSAERSATRPGGTCCIGAGQQSRVDCTRLAGAKTDTWWLARRPKVLALRFGRGLSRQQRINWRVRYIEGDLYFHHWSTSASAWPASIAT
jgi:AICAR transformylase/IMP cyclohydrolase PurH